VPITRRRLWAILVGAARYDDPKLNLSFADNDAIDIARQFVLDFEKRNSVSTSAPPDFQELRLDLLLSPRTQDAETELRDLQNGRPYVTVRKSLTKAAVAKSLEEAVVERTKDRGLSDDVFLFYFSGHGATINNKTVLAMPQTRSDLENWEETSVVSSDLLQMLKQIPGQKIAIFDACRTDIVPELVKLDPNAARMEFEGKVLSAYFFFGGRRGESAVEVPGLTFNKTRSANRQGNGLFTYAFIDALNNKSIAIREDSGQRGLIHIESIIRYLSEQFFARSNRAALMQRIPVERRSGGIPTPVFFQARNIDANKVIRTIDP
jgi:hypothetical protein